MNLRLKERKRLPHRGNRILLFFIFQTQKKTAKWRRWCYTETSTRTRDLNESIIKKKKRYEEKGLK